VGLPVRFAAPHPQRQGRGRVTSPTFDRPSVSFNPEGLSSSVPSAQRARQNAAAWTSCVMTRIPCTMSLVHAFAWSKARRACIRHLWFDAIVPVLLLPNGIGPLIDTKRGPIEGRGSLRKICIASLHRLCDEKQISGTGAPKLGPACTR
jgi:hypothetical protein